jgi:hypothetical protein
MTTRHAACSCGQLHLTIVGEPSRISMCHCLECQRRTGAVISAYRTEMKGQSVATFSYPLPCRSLAGEGDLLAAEARLVAIGTFADSKFPAPNIAVWEESRHPWVTLPPDTPPKRMAKQG